MNRLYCTESPNGFGFNSCGSLELEKSKDYYQFYYNKKKQLDDSDKDSDTDSDDFIDLYEDYIFETKPGICCQCNKDLSLDIQSSNYKLLYPNERLFSFVSKNGNEYWYIYYHYCKDCFNSSLYNWYNKHNKYPRLRFDGGSFVNMNYITTDLLDMGLPVSIDMPKEIIDIFSIYQPLFDL